TVLVSGGAFTAAGAVTFAGATTWSGGNLVGGGSVTNTGTLSLGSNVTLSTTLNNQGTITQTGGTLSLNGGILNNQAAGTYDVQGTGTFLSQANNFGTQFALNNAGTLKRTTSAGTATVAAPFNNTGAVQVLTGALTLGGNNGVSTGGNWTVAGGATLHVSPPTSSSGAPTTNTYAGGTWTIAAGGTLNFNGSNGGPGGAAGVADLSGVTFDNAGTVNLISGTFKASGAVTFTGSTTWSGGTVSGGGAITNAAGATFTVSDSNDTFSAAF